MGKKINTIYIISKGRPHCKTAQCLTKINYEGDWFIVCGNNDETIPEYQKQWGKDRILIFDWYDEIKRSDLLDNFGVKKVSSGAVPVRNATMKLSKARGEKRHWQLDDDYNYFYHIDRNLKKWHRLTGIEFEKELYKLADFADKAGLANIGFALGSDTRPETVKMFGRRVFNAHNMPNDENFTIWKGRTNDDLINAIETFRYGKYEMFVKYMSITMESTQSEKGGNTDLYEADGTIRKTAYAIMVEPANVKFTILHKRYHHRVNWNKIIPKILNERYATS